MNFLARPVWEYLRKFNGNMIFFRITKERTQNKMVKNHYVKNVYTQKKYVKYT